MTNHPGRVNAWEQTYLLPPESVDITLSIMVMPDMGLHHVGMQWADEGNGDLLGMWVAPARSRETMLTDMEELLARVRALVEEVLNPF